MSDGRYVIVGRGKSANEPYAPGDIVDVYELAEPMSLDPTPAPQAQEPEIPPHDLARGAYRRVRSAARAARRSRRLNDIRCTCARRGLLAELVDLDGRRWALVSAERPPRKVRDRAPDGPTAWPLHEEPSGRPHVQPTSCDRCGARWILLIGTRGVTAHRVASVRYAATITP